MRKPDADFSTSLHLQRFAAFAEKSGWEIVQELADREELRELIARYAHRVARATSVADLFTDDGVFIVRIPGRPVSEARSRARLDERFAAMSPQDGALPMIHNYLLTIRENEAAGLCSNELRIIEDGRSIVASGYYEDRFRREEGRWKFVVRDATFFHWAPIDGGWAAKH